MYQWQQSVCRCSLLYYIRLFYTVQDRTNQNSKFLKRLEEFKLRNDLTWDGVAKTVGFSRSLIFCLKSGKHNVTAKVKYALDRAEKAIADADASKVVSTARPDRRLQSSAEKEVQLWMQAIIARLETLPAATRKKFLVELKKRFKA